METPYVAPQPEPQQKSSRPWLWIGGIIALIFFFICICCLAGVLFYAIAADDSSADSVIEVTTESRESTVAPNVGGQTRVPGAGISLFLPDSFVITDEQSDEFSGNWWYDSTSGASIRLFISATQWGDDVPPIDDDYAREVIEDVEESSGNHDLDIESISTATVDGYDARRVVYTSTTQNDNDEYTVALLVGRENDDVFFAIYGSSSDRESIDRAADQIIRSLELDPTPPTYSVTGI